MDFSGQYLSYQEYTSLGGTLQQMPFNILEFKARRLIDERTQNRLNNITTIPQEVKMCVFDLITVLDSYTEYDKQNKSISSENTDGYSISYDTNNKTENKNKDIENIIMTYLINVVVNNEHILYLGRC